VPPAPAPNPLEQALTGALDWWRDAGVSHAFTDEPVQWLKPPEDAAAKVQPDTPAPRPAPPPPPQLGGDRAQWPAMLDAFAPWWMAEPSLDVGPVSERVAPRGAAGAEVMAVVDHPEREDRERLLSGPEGRLLNAFLAAAGVDPAAVYVASALPRCMAMPDWTALAASGLGAVLAHHVELVQPRRLIVFGSNSPSLLGNDPAQKPGISALVNRGGAPIPVLEAPSLAAMIARPARKGGFWQRWLAFSR
jgi:DNA polymerase